MSLGLTRVWKVRLIVAGLVLLALGLAAYSFRGHLTSAFGFITEATGSKTNAVLSLVVALCVLVCLVTCLFAWLVFPIIVFFGLKDLRRRTAELDRTTRLLADLVARRESGPIPRDRLDGPRP